jgi:hypothetical protein
MSRAVIRIGITVVAVVTLGLIALPLAQAVARLAGGGV